jgi:hypothetical protein
MTDIRQLLFNRPTEKMEILTTPVNRLGLDIRRSLLRQPIDRVMAQLRRSGVRLRPNFYLGEEWGCVAGTTNIEIPFYEADEILKELNREGRGWYDDPRTVDHLLRHETGHAFCYTHRLYTYNDFRRAFGVKGKFFDTYPSTDRYKPHPWSRDFVNPHGDHYAQKHPDEDFAETFGVWLGPQSVWKRAYKNKKGAMAKLAFVSDVVRQLGDKPPAVTSDPKELDTPAEAIKQTVSEVLEVPLARYRRRATGYIDPLLRRIGRYRPGPPAPGTVLLADAVVSHRQLIEDALVKNARVTHAQAETLLEKIVGRSRSLQLYVPLQGLERKLLEVMALASTLATRFAVTGGIKPRG